MQCRVDVCRRRMPYYAKRTSHSCIVKELRASKTPNRDLYRICKIALAIRRGYSFLQSVGVIVGFLLKLPLSRTSYSSNAQRVTWYFCPSNWYKVRSP